MIEKDQAYSFEFHSYRRDFRNRAADEIFLLEVESTEADWGTLGTIPRDAIGACALKWPEECKSVTVGFTAFLRRHRNKELGEIFFLQMVISQDDWLRLRDMPRHSLGTVTVTWTARAEELIEKPKPSAKTRKPKTVKEPSLYGQFWYQMDKAGFHNRPDVRAWTGYSGLDDGEAREALRRALKVEHRSLEASPDFVIEAMATAEGLDGAITLIENLKRRGLRVVPKEREAA